MYCFYPSLDAEKGAVQVFSYVPEFSLDFLYSVEIEQWRKVSDGKSLQGKQEDKGKDKKTRKSESNVTLADFLKSEMLEKFKIKRTVTKKDTISQQDRATSMKPSNMNIASKEKQNGTIKLPELPCFNRFSFLEEEQVTEDLDNSVEEFEIKECCRKTKENIKKPKKRNKLPKSKVTKEEIKNDKSKKVLCTKNQSDKIIQEKEIKRSQETFEDSQDLNLDVSRCSSCFVNHFPNRKFCRWALQHDTSKRQLTKEEQENNKLLLLSLIKSLSSNRESGARVNRVIEY